MNVDPVVETRMLLEAATPGPWSTNTQDVGDRYQVIVDLLVGANDHQVMHLSGGYGHPGASDLNLIIAAPRLLAALADEVERLRGALDRSRYHQSGLSSEKIN